jgi:glycosidase
MDKYNATPAADTAYMINRPDAKTREEQKLLLVHQYTFIGAPHIWNGDEVGMWGADDPDCRKPMIWADLKYDDERANFNPARSRPVDKVYPDTALLSFIRSLVELRKENPVLSTGDLKFIVANDEKMVLAYSRSKGSDEIISIFNRSDKDQTISVPAGTGDNFVEIFPTEGKIYKSDSTGLQITLKPLKALVLKRV